MFSNANAGRGALGNTNTVWNVGHGAFGNANAVRNIGRGAFGNANAEEYAETNSVLVEFEL